MEKITVFCGLSSLGMPFPRENKHHIGYYDIILDTLRKSGYEVSGFNMSKLNKNHTWDLENALNNNSTIASIKQIQLESIDALRNANKLFKLVVPKKFKEKIIINSSDYDITLKDIYVNASNPIFIYHGGPNDFFTYIQSGPVELLDRKVREKLPNDLESVVDKCISNIESNWVLLHNLNSNIHIYALSYYYSPLYDKIQKLIYLQDKSIGKKNRFMEIIEYYNKRLLELSMKYDYVDYIDLTFLKDYCATLDFHPTTEGNQLLAQTLLEEVNKIFPINRRAIK